MSDRPTLVLWDVDHTLVEFGGFSRELYAKAFHAAVGRPIDEFADMAGRTEPAIVHDTLTANGVPRTEGDVERFIDAVVAVYTDARDALASHGGPLPGVTATLRRWAALPGVHQGVLTGNVRAVARIKLAAHGLANEMDLDSAGYGDDHALRAALVPIARTRAAALRGIEYPAADTVLVGDTPHDVAAAHGAGARVVAVATGRHDIDTLLAAGADEVLPDLSDPDRTDAALKRLRRL